MERLHEVIEDLGHLAPGDVSVGFEAAVAVAADDPLAHHSPDVVGSVGGDLGAVGEGQVSQGVALGLGAADHGGGLGPGQGGADGLFHPEREITRAEAVTAINRMLGRDESVTELMSVKNPFSDLAESHWACGNVLEAAGVLKDDAAVPKMDSVPQNTSAYHFSSESDGWAASEGQLFHTTNGGKNWGRVGRPLACTVSGLFFFSEQEGILLGSSEENACVLMRTNDGGKSWDDLLANPATLARYLPVEQFPTEKSLLESIVSAELRPASRTAVYLTVRYHPYESVHVYDFEAVRQAVLTADA